MFAFQGLQVSCSAHRTAITRENHCASSSVWLSFKTIPCAPSFRGSVRLQAVGSWHIHFLCCGRRGKEILICDRHLVLSLPCHWQGGGGRRQSFFGAVPWASSLGERAGHCDADFLPNPSNPSLQGFHFFSVYPPVCRVLTFNIERLITSF